MTLTMTFWLVLFGRLIAFAVLFFAISMLAGSASRRAVWSRSVWRACCFALITLLALEVTDLSKISVQWMSAVRFRPAALLAAPPQSVPSSLIQTASVVVTDKATRAESASSAVWWPGVLWMSGTVLLFARMARARISFRLQRRSYRKVGDPILVQRVVRVQRSVGVCSLDVLESEDLETPVAFGTCRPAIGLPRDFDTHFTPAQQEAVLAHELAHLVARDPIWQLLADCMCALWWWHPLVWWTRRRLAFASECAADEASLGFQSGPETLAECLVTLGKRLVSTSNTHSLGMAGTGLRSGLARRVEHLLQLSQLPTAMTLTRWMHWARVGLWGAFVVGAFGISAGSFGATRSTEYASAGWQHSLAGRTLAALQPQEAKTTSSSSATAPGPRSPGDVKASGLDAKLDSIHLDEWVSDNLSPRQAIQRLMAESRELDPGGAGIEFWIADTGSALNRATLRHEPRMEHPTLRDVLNAIMRASSVPLDYKVGARWVLVRRVNTNSGLLHTRTFGLDTNRWPHQLSQWMQSTLAPGDWTTLQDGTTREGSVTRKLFEEAGIHVDPPSAIFYKPQAGLLLVRASLEDLDVVEAVITRVMTSPPQLLIEAKLVEVSDAAALALGLDKSLGFAAEAEPMARVVEPSSRAMFAKSFLDGGAQFETGARIPKAKLIAQLSAQEFQWIMRGLEKQQGVNVLSAPKLITLSDRQAQIKIIEFRSVVVDTDRSHPGEPRPIAEAIEQGPTLDIVPHYEGLADSIQLRVISSLREFVGSSEEKSVLGNPKDRRALPRLRMRQVVASGSVANGQTLVVSAGAVDDRDDQPEGKRSSKPKGRRTLLVFLTPQIIDAAGKSDVVR